MTTPIYDALLAEAQETLGLDWGVTSRPRPFAAYFTLWCAQGPLGTLVSPDDDW